MTHLCEILANGLGGVAEIVAEGTGAACLAGTLPEELARDMACVCALQLALSGPAQLTCRPVDDKSAP
jgi:hypothetical protein